MSSSDVFTCVLDGKRVHLHDLRRLPSGTTTRSVCYSIKGGGSFEKLQVHTRESLRSRTKQEVRAISTALGIKRGSGARDARVYYSKEELIDRILQHRSDEEQSAHVGDLQSASSSSAASTALRSTSVQTSSTSSQSSLAHMFAAQRETRAATEVIPPSGALDPAPISSSASLSKPLSRHNRYYDKTGKRKYKKKYDKEVRAERYAKLERVVAKRGMRSMAVLQPRRGMRSMAVLQPRRGMRRMAVLQPRRGMRRKEV